MTQKRKAVAVLFLVEVLIFGLALLVSEIPSYQELGVGVEQFWRTEYIWHILELVTIAGVFVVRLFNDGDLRPWEWLK